jgi:hypothetical protein
VVGTFSFFSGVLSLNCFQNPVNNNQTEKDTRRAFLLTQKKEMLAKQVHKYARRHKKLGVGNNFDLIKPWAEGEKTTVRNGQVLCAQCHELLRYQRNPIASRHRECCWNSSVVDHRNLACSSCASS